MAHLKLFVFGPPRLERDGQPIALGVRKVLALLVYLAVTGQAQSRDSLATLLWPESGQQEARARLRRTLHRLSQVLGEGVLEVSSDTIRLPPQADLWLDSAAFQQHVAAGLAPGQPMVELTPECLAHLTQAAKLYTDDFLAGFTLPDSPAFDEWQFFERERLRQAFAQGLERLVQAYQAQGAWKEAIGSGRRWVALDPLHEPAQRALMWLYAWAGRQAAALHQYQECVRVLAADLGVAPDSETTTLYEAIRTKQLAPPTAAARMRAPPTPVPDAAPYAPPPHPKVLHNLPAQPTPFVGRDRELAELRQILADPDCRLVMVLGPGGVGKTRLALEAASTVQDAFPQGVYVVPLAPFTSPEHLISTLAEQVGFRFYQPGDPHQQLLTYLREKQLLLLLDNFEHMLEGAGLVTEILLAAPRVKILVTSRERLHLSGEAVYTLGSMAVPEAGSDQHALEYGAVQLLMQSARLARPNLDLRSYNLEAIARICRLVQGMPLALVLAASWVEVLSFEEIAEEIEHSLDFLESQLRDIPERQRSVRAAFDYSWRWLSVKDQQTFMKLSVFRGGFTRQAAQTVTGAGLRALRTLVSKSFLSSGRGGRYEVHELLRQFGAEHLAASGDANRTRDAHSEYYLDMLNQHGADLSGPRQLEALDEIEADIKNIRAAWDWAVEHDRLEAIEQTCTNLYRYYQIRSRYHEGEEIFARAADHLRQLKAPDQHPRFEAVLGRVLARWGAFWCFLGDYEAASERLQESLDIAHRLGHRSDAAYALNLLGQVAGWQGKASEAKQLLHESLAISKDINDKTIMVNVLERLAQIYVHLGEYVGGKQLAEESLAISRQFGRPDWIAHALDTLGWATFCLGEYPQSEEYYQESLAIFERIGDQSGIALALGGLGLAAAIAGGTKATTAIPYLERGVAICREIGHQLHLSSRLFILGMLANSTGEHDRARQYCQEGLDIARELGSPIFIGSLLGMLGEALCGLGEFRASRKYLLEALQMMAQARLLPQLLGALFQFAALLVKESDLAGVPESVRAQKKVLAVEQLALVAHHPKSRQDVKDKAKCLLAQLESELPAEVMAAARAQGGYRSLDEIVAEILESERATPSFT